MAQLGAVVAVASSFFCASLFSAVHKIEEGHIGVYYRGGALLTSTSGPGFHLMLPFITSYKSVQVRVACVVWLDHYKSGLLTNAQCEVI